jgi:hypothetical protein
VSARTLVVIGAAVQRNPIANEHYDWQAGVRNCGVGAASGPMEPAAGNSKRGRNSRRWYPVAAENYIARLHPGLTGGKCGFVMQPRRRGPRPTLFAGLSPACGREVREPPGVPVRRGGEETSREGSHAMQRRTA